MQRPKPTGAAILRLIRDGIATDWDSLVRTTMDWDFSGSGLTGLDPSHLLMPYLNKLRAAGLITFADPSSSQGADGKPVWSITKGVDGPIKLSAAWFEIREALGVSWTKIAALQEDSIVVEPVFGLPVEQAQPSDLFVVMPFAPALRAVFDDHILSVADSLELTAKRGDDSFTAHAIMSDIWSSICSSRAVIAECTGRNANVFYELGIAHTLGKPVVLITQDKGNTPFDIGHIRHIEYDLTREGMKVFEQSLTATLRTVLGLPTPRRGASSPRGRRRQP